MGERRGMGLWCLGSVAVFRFGFPVLAWVWACAMLGWGEQMQWDMGNVYWGGWGAGRHGGALVLAKWLGL